MQSTSKIDILKCAYGSRETNSPFYRGEINNSSLHFYFEGEAMEIWKPLKNFPSYNGSSEGRIINVRTQHILKPYLNENGYPIIRLRRNNKCHTVRLHRIIAETFLGEHPNMDVRHKDRDRLNNHVDNLEWVMNQTAIKVVETGMTYESVSECARDTGCDRRAIYRYLSGGSKHVNGLHFEKI
jgi:hypothetical protein